MSSQAAAPAMPARGHHRGPGTGRRWYWALESGERATRSAGQGVRADGGGDAGCPGAPAPPPHYCAVEAARSVI